MAEDTTKYIPLGPCAVVVGGVDLGDTDEKGATAMVKTDHVLAHTGKSGSAGVAALEKGKQVEVDFVLVQTDLVGVLQKAFPNLTTFAVGGTALGFGVTSGTLITPQTLKLTSYIAANTPGDDFTLRAAVPVGDFKPVYNGEAFQGWTCKFIGLFDETASAGRYIGTFGNDAAGTNATVPTATVVPADDAAAQSNTNIVWTITNGKTIDPATVKAGVNVFVEQWSGAIGTNSTPVAGTVVLDNTAHTITFTPTSAFGTFSYSAHLLNVKDTDGNLLASGDFYSDFAHS